MAIKSSKKAMNNNSLLHQIFIFIGKFIIGICLASIIYSFYKFISFADLRIAIAYLEAKVCGSFSSSYKISYISKYGFKLTKPISEFFTDSHVIYVSSKYQLVFLNGLFLGFYIILVILLLIFTLREDIKEIMFLSQNQTLNPSQASPNIPSNSVLLGTNTAKPRQKSLIEYQDL